METPAEPRFGHSDPTPEQLRAQFGRLLGMTAGHTQRIVNGALADVGARKYHFAVLATLDEFGPSSQAQLSDRTGIYRSDLVATVNELAADGYVRREADPGDRRRNVVSMTEAGGERLGQLAAILTRTNAAILAPFDAEERERLTGLLHRLLEHVADRGSW
ncbi:MarR family winged helix-turn-helix transcriptional regulator [Glycomyces tenuis]|uniref:MarR family winged helix-turn-helix transcriptional regulator n=1 Tax=Glycomyces tenuis TaxID=58116 RepID=UPI00047AD85A|nr:MarR family transcriptional regulator [Glycomyces tenuis]